MEGNRDMELTAEQETNNALLVGSNEVVDLLSGEIIDTSTTDGLITALERVNSLDAQVYAAKLAIKQAIALKAQGGTKTQRVAGETRIAKVEFPSDKWNTSALKDAWEKFPQFRGDYLRIAKVDPQLREVKKLAETYGTPELEEFKKVVLGANEGPSGSPTITIEK